MRELSFSFLKVLSSLLIFFLVPAAAKAEVTFRKVEIKVGSERLKVEVAETEAQRSQGLMNRTKLGDKEGMLFVFSTPQKVSFWMKDTLIPLAIGFFDASGRLLATTEMAPPASALEVSLPHYDSPPEVLMALEVPKGWFKRKKIKIGDKLKQLSANGKP